MPRPAADSVEAVFREERSRLLAALASRFGDLDLAEEVTQEALEAALTRWPVDGVPDVPLAWLLTTARRRAVDRLRRDRTRTQRLAELTAEAGRAGPAVPAAPSDPDGELPDERLTLFFTCAHPALPLEAQLALTLRFLAGLSTEEVAAAFLVPVPTMQQRIVRAKNKITHARIPFTVPDGDQRRARLATVLSVLYLVFTEGYASSAGVDLIRTELCDEAIRLAHILRRLLPGESEVAGLLALMLLTDARRDARTDPDGVPVSLEDQDRGLWDAAKIADGRRLLHEALATPGSGPYAVQAAIAALHDEARDVATTDWAQVVALYDVLLTMAPSPVVALNRAVAVAMRDGPAAGLALIDRLADRELRHHHPLPAARADLLARLGRAADAADAYRTALRLVGNEPDRVYLTRRLRATEDDAVGGTVRRRPRHVDEERPMSEFQPQLWVEKAATAVAFYEAAFGAVVLHRVGEGEDIVAQLAVDDATFWVSTASAAMKRHSPHGVGGTTGRTLLVTDDPDAVVRRAVDAGAHLDAAPADEHGWRLGRIVDPFGHEWEVGRPPG